MLFWILLVILIAAVVAVFVIELREWGGLEDALMPALGVALFGGIAGGLIILVTGLAAPAYSTATGTDTYTLRSVGTGSGTQGKITSGVFLTTGYINTTRVLNYVWQDSDGDVHVDSAKGTASVVREDGGAKVEVHHWRFDEPWWYVPWNLGGTDTYTFHVPAGSVQGGYEVGSK